MTTHDVEREIRELEKVRSQLRIWRTATTLALLAITIGGVGLMYNAVNRLMRPGPTQDQFASALSTNLQRDVLPQVQTIASQSLVEIRPQVEKEFQKLNTRVPELSQTSMQQLELLQKNVTTRSQKVLEKTLGTMLMQKEDKVRQMFPDVTPEKVERAMNNIAKETQNRLVSSHETLFSSHMDALNGIVVNIDKIQQSERVQPNAEAADWETAASLLDLVNDQVQEFRPLVAAQSKSSQGSAQVPAPKMSSGQNNAPKSNVKSTSSTRSSTQTSTKTTAAKMANNISNSKEASNGSKTLGY